MAMDFTPCKSMQNDELELTRNPFDSRELDKENLPPFSPSIFVVSGCASSEKKNKSFRWSIDQIAVLKPADIDEFPNQEYSGSYERHEDEAAAQKAIDEYFSNVILPSPWTANSKQHIFKKVTFSPHPPTYFKETSHESSSSSSANSSQNGGEKKFVDGSCQTTLTIPPNIDLMRLLGEKFYTYKEPRRELNAKELNVSTLRRKLFSPGDASPEGDQKGAGERTEVKDGIRSTTTPPRTPRTPNWVTSSPYRDGTPNKAVASDNDSVFQSSFVGDPLSSPVLSPIKTTDENKNYDDDDDIDVAKSFTRLDSSDSSLDFSISSIKNSPSRGEKFVSSDLELSPVGRSNKSVAFHPKSFAVETMYTEQSDLFADIIESTRVVPVEIPGFSPIKCEDETDVSMMSTSKYDQDVQFNGNSRNSVKESTANHIHGITGLFSPIRDGANSARDQRDAKDDGWKTADDDGNDSEDDSEDDSVYDDGPLEITDLSLPPDNFIEPEDEASQNTADESDVAVEVIVSSFPTPKRGILKQPSQRGTPVTPRNTYEHRLENIEEKIGRVESEIEMVKNSCENDIKEIKKSLTPARKDDGGKRLGMIGFNSPRNRAVYTKGSNSRRPLQDCTNKNMERRSANQKHSSIEHDSSKEESIIRNGYFALDRAKRVQRKIDEDFDLCLHTSSRETLHVALDNSDFESAEVARILTTTTGERFTREGHRLDLIENDSRVLVESKFREYRFRNVRESLNDSWDLKSKTGSDVSEMDSSVFSAYQGDNGAPTPIMNLEGLSIYNAPRENRVPLQKPIPVDRRWVIESGKSERRHTWPTVKPYKTYATRTVSPTFASKYRASRGYSIAKQDVVNRLKDEWKLKPSQRTNSYSISR